MSGGGGAASGVGVGSLPADPLGTNSDAAVTTGATGSISAKLRTIQIHGDAMATGLGTPAAAATATGSINAHLRAAVNYLDSIASAVQSVDALFTVANAIHEGTATVSGAFSIVASATTKKRVIGYVLSADTSNTVAFRGATGGANLTAIKYLPANGGAVAMAPQGAFLFETATGVALSLFRTATGIVSADVIYGEV